LKIDDLKRELYTAGLKIGERWNILVIFPNISGRTADKVASQIFYLSVLFMTCVFLVWSRFDESIFCRDLPTGIGKLNNGQLNKNMAFIDFLWH
jgi:hypothetical protein